MGVACSHFGLFCEAVGLVYSESFFFIEKSRQNVWPESKLALSLHPLSERNSMLRRSLIRFHTDK